jgi:GntR family transcriptional regulator/MocR family aminotransferase
MLSALRLGFVVAPHWALQTLIAAKNCLDWHCPTPIQLGVAGFIAEGHLARHERKMREIYKQRRQLLLKLLDSKLSDWVVPIPSFYGMHIAVTMRDGAPDPDMLAQTLLERNVKIHSLGRYYVGPRTRSGLVLGYGAVGLAEITRGVSALRSALLEG